MIRRGTQDRLMPGRPPAQSDGRFPQDGARFPFGHFEHIRHTATWAPTAGPWVLTDGRGDVAAEGFPIALGLGHGDEEPGLAFAAGRRVGAGLADLANERQRHRVRLQAADGPGRRDGGHSTARRR